MRPGPKSQRVDTRARFPFGESLPTRSQTNIEHMHASTINYLKQNGTSLVDQMLRDCLAHPTEAAANRVADEMVKYLQTAIPYPLNEGLSMKICASTILLFTALRLREMTPEGNHPPPPMWYLFTHAQRFATLAFLLGTPASRIQYCDLSRSVPWIEDAHWKRHLFGALSVARVIAECLRTNISCLLADPLTDALDGIDLFILFPDEYSGSAVQVKTRAKVPPTLVREYDAKLLYSYPQRVAAFNQKKHTKFRPHILELTLHGGHQSFDPGTLWTPEIEQIVKILRNELANIPHTFPNTRAM